MEEDNELIFWMVEVIIDVDIVVLIFKVMYLVICIDVFVEVFFIKKNYFRLCIEREFGWKVFVVWFNEMEMYFFLNWSSVFDKVVELFDYIYWLYGGYIKEEMLGFLILCFIKG